MSLNQVHFFGGSESQGVQVPQQPVSRAAPLPAATRPPRELDVAEHSARALVTHPTARGAAVTPQAAGRASKTHPRSEGARTPAGPSAAATAAADGRPARNGRTDGADLRVIRSAAASHHAPHPPDMHPAVITSEQAAPTTQRRKGPQRPHPAATTAAVRGRHGAERQTRACTYLRSAAASQLAPPPRLIRTRPRALVPALALRVLGLGVERESARDLQGRVEGGDGGVVCVWVTCAAVRAESWGVGYFSLSHEPP